MVGSLTKFLHIREHTLALPTWTRNLIRGYRRLFPLTTDAGRTAFAISCLLLNFSRFFQTVLKKGSFSHLGRVGA